jgi:hypothetical protein
MITIRWVMGCFIILPFMLFSQESQLNLSFITRFGNETTSFGVKYPLNDAGDSISFSTLRFYISNVRFYDRNKEVASSQSVFLFDQSTNYTKELMGVRPPNFDHIYFDIGVDSISNTLGAQDGELDPVNGMYWTWQSGYINFKLEGWSNRCTTRKSLFAYHIGGYSSPYNNLRSVYLPIPNISNLKIIVDLKLLFTSIDLKQTSTVMSPNKESIILADYLPSLFSIDGDEK